MTRKDFQALARTRLADAEALLQAGQFDGAFYLLGFAVECGLKACIARLIRRHEFPNKQMTIDSYSHDLSKLVKTAGLESALNADIGADPHFNANWMVVKDWSVESRYSVPGKLRAEALSNAVNDRRHGVMRWIRQRW
jgi:hypothetical protein